LQITPPRIGVPVFNGLPGLVVIFDRERSRTYRAARRHPCPRTGGDWPRADVIGLVCDAIEEFASLAALIVSAMPRSA
jgi:hypothetical protein